MLTKEGVAKKKEVLTILTMGQVFEEAPGLARVSGGCCGCCHTVMQPSFCSRVLERGRGRAAAALVRASGALSLEGSWGLCWRGARPPSWPLAPRTGTALGMDGEEGGDASKRAG